MNMYNSKTNLPLIEIHDATVFRGATRVFHRFSLVLEKLKNTAIIRPNGSGKSTLLKILTRELYPVFSDQSFVRILGDEHSDIWSLRSKLGLVSSDLHYEYTNEATGIEVIVSGFFSSVGIWGHHDPADHQIKKAKEVIEKLGIIELRDKKYGALSTGQQRRLLLGRALVNNPPSLIFDEPTTGLDLTATFQYLDLMQQLIKSGRTLILVTHHLHEIPPEIQRVILLKNGEIFADGSKQMVLTSASLTELYDQPIELLEKDGWYQAIPG